MSASRKILLNLCVSEPKLNVPLCCGIISEVIFCNTVKSKSLLPPTPTSKSISSPSPVPEESIALRTTLLPSWSNNICPLLVVDVELFNSYLSVVALYVRTSPSSCPAFSAPLRTWRRPVKA